VGTYGAAALVAFTGKRQFLELPNIDSLPVLCCPVTRVGCKCGTCGAPVLVAFTGKRQFLELLNIDSSGQLRRGKHKIASATVQLGKQPPGMLPPGWPLPVGKTEVWVLTSTSGAAPMSNADRERPYRQLAERLVQIGWPLSGLGVRCGEL
jgi:TDG/mug DNA glycosylase family protein